MNDRPTRSASPVFLVLGPCVLSAAALVLGPPSASFAQTGGPSVNKKLDDAQVRQALQAGPAEDLLRKWDALPRQTTAKEYDQFLAAHPGLLKMAARPYGSALMWSLEFEKAEAALSLLRAGAEVPEGAVTLAARGGMADVIPILVGHGVTAKDRDLALHAAAKYGHAGTLRLLISLGAAVSTPAPLDGFTPLHVAVMERKIECIQVLLSAHAALEARDHNGQTPLSWGPFAYRPQEQHLYEKLGAPHGTRYVDPGEAKGIQMLVEAGANLHAKDDAGDTPLHQAVRLGSRRGVEALLALGAKDNVKNKAGETPVGLAKKRKDKDILALFSARPR
ncbi:MAG TPA: ankyrin repeat domain-containing protein [Pseudomonadota bacterium]|nr:ankyrin repeat domain-containing protein [Pseudomonadota bacterium]